MKNPFRTSSIYFWTVATLHSTNKPKSGVFKTSGLENNFERNNAPAFLNLVDDLK